MRLINAHKLEKEFKRIYNVTQNCQSLDWGTVKNTIRDQSEVDPVKHGHWMLRTDGADENFSIMYKCSACRGTSPKPVLYEYCPMCGAKMDEVIE